MIYFSVAMEMLLSNLRAQHLFEANLYKCNDLEQSITYFVRIFLLGQKLHQQAQGCWWQSAKVFRTISHSDLHTFDGDLS